ncbi:chemotaxis protein CheW [Marinibaculum pumilum]|uniref:Chemotaxis protein CheW n=1 Tax=Marinibaculum pumilum TaxID=1766165 RepID=A0ABV7L9F2_9PROT
MQADGASARIDDCWNRIGIAGDRSCPLLADHIHCRNCPVQSAAAIALLDRFAAGLPEQAAQDDSPTRTAGAEPGAQRRLLVFRVGAEWLGLAPRSLLEIAPAAAIHSLPHQRNAAILGVANRRGTLIPCISLARFLDTAETEAELRHDDRRIVPRTLILAAEDGAIAAPVDEVDGIQAVSVAALLPAAKGARPIGRYAAGVLRRQGRSITLLDDAAFLRALAGSLA